MKKEFEFGRALLIGIGQAYTGRLALPSVVRADAEAIGRVLTDPKLCGYPPENVRQLLDEEATRIHIIEGFRWLSLNSKDTDTVLIFFSGHGGRRPHEDGARTFLCPVDFDSADPFGTGIEADELSELIDSIPAARIVIAFDACHSEGAVHLKSEDGEKGFISGLNAPTLDRLASGVGRVVVASCKEDEVSMTYVEKGNSLFTHFLVEGLRGAAVDRGDGLVRVLDLFHYVSEEVPKHARQGNVQHPVLKAHAETNFPLALRHGGWLKGENVTMPVPVPVPVPLRSYSLDIRQLERTFVQLYPSGPMHDEIWSRAGGDISALASGGNGRASWHSAIKMLSLGGGGAEITLETLLETARIDFPNNSTLNGLAP